MKKVFIVGGNASYRNMFLNRGWDVTTEVNEADVVQFTGGHDVSPHLYGEELHPTTYPFPTRDEEEQKLFNHVLYAGKPMLGICRGAQFLNVMCGGKMYQHVNGHATGQSHIMVDSHTGKMYTTTSTHHQMMRPGPDATLIAVASESTRYESVQDGGIIKHTPERGEDVEVVYYRDQNCLCFQGHPEFLDKDDPCQEYYFELIEEYCFNAAN